MAECEDLTIRWCRITDIQHTGQDAQGVWGSNTKGNIRIEDCYIAATGQCVFFGGGLAQDETYVPSDITVERCYLAKLPRWNSGRPEYDGKSWVVKPTLELKMARRVRIIGNILDSSFSWPALVFDAFDQYPPWNSGPVAGGVATAEITDVEAAHNTILGDAMGGVQIWAANAPVKRVRVWNNLALNIKYATPGSAGPSYIRGAFLYLLPGAPMEDIWVEQNTAITDRGAGTITLNGPKIQRLRLAKNILGYGHGGFSVEGYWTTEDWALQSKADGLEVVTNALVDFGDAVGGTRSPAYVQSSFDPPHSAVGEWIIAGIPSVAGIDPVTGQLTAGGGLSGLGVDFSALLAAQSGPAPTPTPVPEVKMTGYFDGFVGNKVFGWAQDQNNPRTRVTVTLSINGVQIGSTIANIFRQDLLDAHIDDGIHGWEFEIPAQYQDGQPHTLRCFVGTFELNYNVSNSFTLAAPAPPPPTTTPLTDAEIQKIRKVLGYFA